MSSKTLTHGGLFLDAAIGGHPRAAAMAAAALVVVVLVLAYYALHYKNKCAPAAKSSFGPRREGLAAGAGAGAGKGPAPGKGAGPVKPCGAWTADAIDEAKALASVGGLEQDSFGESALQTAAEGGAAVGCGGPWSPDAVAESQALAAVGGFAQDGYGEDALQAAVGEGPTTGRAVSDAQLHKQLHGGEASA